MDAPQPVICDEVEKREAESSCEELEKKEVEEVKPVKEKKGLKKKDEQIQDLFWCVSVLRKRSKKEEDRKQKMQAKIEFLEKKVGTYEAYHKRSIIQEKALADLRVEAEALRNKHEEDTERIRELDQALTQQLAEADKLTAMLKKSSCYIKIIEGQMDAAKLAHDFQVEEETRGSHRRACSMPPRPAEEYIREEEAVAEEARIKALIEDAVVPNRPWNSKVTEEVYECKMRERAAALRRYVTELRAGSTEAVRLRAHGIAGI